MANAPFRMASVHLVAPGSGDSTACGMIKRLTSYSADVREVTCAVCRATVRPAGSGQGAAHG